MQKIRRTEHDDAQPGSVKSAANSCLDESIFHPFGWLVKSTAPQGKKCLFCRGIQFTQLADGSERGMSGTWWKSLNP